MRLITEDRLRRLISLSEQLEELATTKHELLRKLADLETRERAIQREYKALHNLDAPTFDLPSEIISKIFEEGLALERFKHPHSGIIASHVSRRWRHIALQTPRLWSNVQILFEWTETSWLVHQRTKNVISEKTAAFLSRSRSIPVDICIWENHENQLPVDLIQVVDDHMGHCGSISITTSYNVRLQRIIQSLSSKPLPVLRSIKFTSESDIVEFKAPLFPLGVSGLKIAQICSFKVLTMNHCLQAFRSITSLRLTLFIRPNDASYNEFRNGLMALPLLNHLDINMICFEPPPFRLPIILPTIEFFHLDSYRTGNIVEILGLIHLPSLATLSLHTMLTSGHVEITALHELPQVQHLIISDTHLHLPDYRPFARVFSNAKRLTVIASGDPAAFYGAPVVIKILCDSNGELLWPKIQTIALSPSNWSSDPSLKSIIVKAQSADHPIRKVMFPQVDVGDDVTALREIVEVEAWHVDWSNPFEQVYF